MERPQGKAELDGHQDRVAHCSDADGPQSRPVGDTGIPKLGVQGRECVSRRKDELAVRIAGAQAKVVADSDAGPEVGKHTQGDDGDHDPGEAGRVDGTSFRHAKRL